MVLEFPPSFVGQVKKITLTSFSCYFDGLPEDNCDDRQKLTISASGGVTYTSKLYTLHKFPPVSEGKWLKMSLPKTSAQDVLNRIALPFRNYKIMPKCTDIGDWILTITNIDGNIFTYSGSLCDDCFPCAKEISHFVRCLLRMPYLYMFDGNYKS